MGVFSLKIFAVCLNIFLFVNSSNSNPTAGDLQCDNTPNDLKVDCNPDNGKQETCTARGCCWKLPKDTTKGIPWCYFPSNYVGYKIGDINRSDNLTRIVLRRGTVPSGFPDDVQTLYFDIIHIDNNRFRIKITDSIAQRYEVAYPKLNIKKEKEDQD